jgi:RNA polymerase sigma-70 factor (ECF subfamily)
MYPLFSGSHASLATHDSVLCQSQRIPVRTREQQNPCTRVLPRPIKNPRLSSVSASSGRTPERFTEYLLGLAGRMIDRQLQSKVDPSDLVQQVLIKAHQRIDQFRGQTDGEFASWLRRMLANVMADTYRKYQCAVSRERSLGDDIDSSRLEGYLADQTLSPSEQAERNEQSLRLAAALNKLPSAERSAIRLRYLEGCSVAEAAVAVKRTHAGVAGLLRRGLARLRREMAPE